MESLTSSPSGSDTSPPHIPDATEGLTDLDVASGVNREGQPFCMILASGEDGTRLQGEMNPDELRTLAMHWNHAAEAAEQDALLFQVLTQDSKMDEAAAAQFIVMMRDKREKLNPSNGS